MKSVGAAVAQMGHVRNGCRAGRNGHGDDGGSHSFQRGIFTDFVMDGPIGCNDGFN